MNNSFTEIADKLSGAERIYLFPHENPDGDAIGSTAALCSMLRDMGKECYVMIQEELPGNLRFMDDDMFVIPEENIEEPDLSVAVDCSKTSRFSKLKDLFLSGSFSIALDHHENEDPDCDMNYIDPEAAAAGEIIYKLMKAMDHMPSKKEAESLFAAITTDTGNFQYSNTTQETHSIVCDLYESGIDISSVSTEIYENESREKVMLICRAVSSMELFCDGKIALTKITQDMLDETGAVLSDAEPVIEKLRSVSGVEIAIVLKEHEPEKVYVSLRSKSYVSVLDIARELGGGGHPKAAGCNLRMTIQEAEEKVLKAAEGHLE